ncbi:MAG: hypothetical protein ACLSCU_00165 [Eubacterium sp.]
MRWQHGLRLRRGGFLPELCHGTAGSLDVCYFVLESKVERYLDLQSVPLYISSPLQEMKAEP